MGEEGEKIKGMGHRGERGGGGGVDDRLMELGRGGKAIQRPCPMGPRLHVKHSMCSFYGEDSALSLKQKEKNYRAGVVGGVKATQPGKSHKAAENVPI